MFYKVHFKKTIKLIIITLYIIQKKDKLELYLNYYSNKIVSTPAAQIKITKTTNDRHEQDRANRGVTRAKCNEQQYSELLHIAIARNTVF